MKQLRLSPDYFCSPLWDDAYDDPDKDPEIKPEHLELSEHLCADIWRWAETFDCILNMDSPVDSGFASSDEEEKFYRRGFDLARMIVSELNGKASVRYRYGNREVVIYPERAS